jgi:hypothetical protein
MYRVRLLVVFALCGTAGCSGCNRPPGAREDTAQGQRLKELFDNGVTVPVEVEGDVPLTFEPVRIDRHEKDSKGYYQAVLAWAPAEKAAPMETYLRERVQRNTHELNTAYGRVSAFRLHVAYGTGDPDDVDVRLGGKDHSATLEKFAAADRPTAVTVSLRSATWYEDEVLTPCRPMLPGESSLVGRKLILVAPGDLPIRFDDCPLDGDRDAHVQVHWHLMGDATALARRAAELTELNPHTAGRQVKSVRLLLTYRDRFGRPLRPDEDVLLDVTAGQGTLSPSNLRRGDALGSVAIRGVSVTWKERTTQVEFKR